MHPHMPPLTRRKRKMPEGYSDFTTAQYEQLMRYRDWPAWNIAVPKPVKKVASE